MPSRRTWIILLLMVMIAAVVAAVTLNSGLQQVKKENDALNTRISGLKDAIRAERISQASQPSIADFEKSLAAEKANLETARTRLPASANLVNILNSFIHKAEDNYLVAVPLSSDPPVGDLAKSTYLRANIRLQLTGNQTDLVVFLSGIERAGSGDYLIESIQVSLDPPAGIDTIPPLNESIVTAQVTISVNYRPAASATPGATK